MQLSTRRSSCGRRLQMSVESSMGKHGNGAVGEIDAGAAQARFEIEIRSCAHILGDIGDMDLEFETAVGAVSDEDRIVEVARGFAVDGDDGKAAEVAPPIGFHIIEESATRGLRRAPCRERRAAIDACGSSFRRQPRSRRDRQAPQ